MEKKIFQSVKTKKAYRLIGAALFFKSDVFVEINGFDENTFLGAEEEIIAVRESGFGIKGQSDRKHLLSYLFLTDLVRFLQSLDFVF